MRYELKAPIQGDLLSKEDNLFAEKDNTIISLIKDQSGRITHISINVKIPEAIKHKFQNSIKPGAGKIKLNIQIGGDKDFEEFLKSKLRIIEAELAFRTYGAFWRIIWTEIEFKLYAENPDEEKTINVTGYSRVQSYPPKPTLITTSGFKAVIELTEDNSYLSISKSFWQEGMNFFRNYNYIQAFYSFFFILEDFFAEGKTAEDEVVKRFSRSIEFREAGEYALNSINKEQRHNLNIQNFFKEEQIEFSLENLPKFLFKMRGRTHHYSRKSIKKQATPFNQKEFESVAFLTMLIASMVIDKKSEKEAKETGKKIPYITNKKQGG